MRHEGSSIANSALATAGLPATHSLAPLFGAAGEDGTLNNIEQVGVNNPWFIPI
jgi:hypothetical protein